jgi:hypothetical protein
VPGGDTLACRRGGGWGPNIGEQTKKKLKRGGPNISVRLAYFHPNRLLTGLYTQETEILLRKNNGNIKKQTEIDRHSPAPSLNSSQPPDLPHFSLLTTFKEFLSTF